MAYNFRKEQKELYSPKRKPAIIDVPKMNYLAVFGSDREGRDSVVYKQALELLKPVALVLRRSNIYGHPIEGFFEYLLPPFETMWWKGTQRPFLDYANEGFDHFIALIRLPDFVSKEDVDWALDFTRRRERRDFSKVQFLTINEGKCVQMLHNGMFENEVETLNELKRFAHENNLEFDLGFARKHHEIYVKNPNKVKNEESLRTGIRVPVREIN